MNPSELRMRALEAIQDDADVHVWRILSPGERLSHHRDPIVRMNFAEIADIIEVTPEHKLEQELLTLIASLPDEQKSAAGGCLAALALDDAERLRVTMSLQSLMDCWYDEAIHVACCHGFRSLHSVEGDVALLGICSEDRAARFAQVLAASSLIHGGTLPLDTMPEIIERLAKDEDERVATLAEVLREDLQQKLRPSAETSE